MEAPNTPVHSSAVLSWFSPTGWHMGRGTGLSVMFCFLGALFAPPLPNVELCEDKKRNASSKMSMQFPSNPSKSVLPLLASQPASHAYIKAVSTLSGFPQLNCMNPSDPYLIWEQRPLLLCVCRGSGLSSEWTQVWRDAQRPCLHTPTMT